MRTNKEHLGSKLSDCSVITILPVYYMLFLDLVIHNYVCQSVPLALLYIVLVSIETFNEQEISCKLFTVL